MVENLVSQLRQVELFSELNGDDIVAVAELAREEHHPVGSLISRQGERGHRWYLIKRGELQAIHVDRDGLELPVNC